MIDKIRENDIYFKNGYIAKDDIESETGFCLIDALGEYVSRKGKPHDYAWSLEEIFGFINVGGSE